MPATAARLDPAAQQLGFVRVDGQGAAGRARASASCATACCSPARGRRAAEVFVYFAAAGTLAAALVALAAASWRCGNRCRRGCRQRLVVGAAAAQRPRAHGAPRHRRARRSAASSRLRSPADRSAAPAAVVAGAQRLDLLPGARPVDLVEAHERLRRHRRHELRLRRRRAHDPAGEAHILGLDERAGRHPRLAGRRRRRASSPASPRRGRAAACWSCVREIRIPGGEIIYDREMRLLRLKNRERAYAGLPGGNLRSLPAACNRSDSRVAPSAA